MALFRLTPLPGGKLVTGGNVMDKTSERELKAPKFVHPMMAESLRQSGESVEAKRNARAANKRANAAVSSARRSN